MDRLMTNDDFIAIFEQASCVNLLTNNSIKRVMRVLNNQAKEARVIDFEGGAEGTFTLNKFRNAWKKVAKKNGMRALEFYESGIPDANDYSEAFEIATFGEVIYG